jgi:hypothetical protein
MILLEVLWTHDRAAPGQQARGEPEARRPAAASGPLGPGGPGTHWHDHDAQAAQCRGRPGPLSLSHAEPDSTLSVTGHG